MDALKPAEVHDAIARHRVRGERRNRRKTAAFVRQGEWFFVPVGRWVDLPLGQAMRNEPLVRTGGGKPHVAEYASRRGGMAVYLHRQTGKVISPAQYAKLHRSGSRDAGNYDLRQRDMQVMVRGRVSHPDHATIFLRDWHFVFMNTEHLSPARRFMTFVD
jgi:hypothetical protein